MSLMCCLDYSVVSDKDELQAFPEEHVVEAML